MKLKQLDFNENKLVKRANDNTALNEAIANYDITGWTSGIDPDTGNVLFFLKLSELAELSSEEKEQFLDKLKKVWNKNKLQILEEKELKDRLYYDVAFPSYFFRLKDI